MRMMRTIAYDAYDYVRCVWCLRSRTVAYDCVWCVWCIWCIRLCTMRMMHMTTYDAYGCVWCVWCVWLRTVAYDYRTPYDAYGCVRLRTMRMVAYDCRLICRCVCVKTSTSPAWGRVVYCRDVTTATTWLEWAKIHRASSFYRQLGWPIAHGHVLTNKIAASIHKPIRTLHSYTISQS